MKFTKRRVLRSLLYAYVWPPPPPLPPPIRVTAIIWEMRKCKGGGVCSCAREMSAIDGASGRDRFHFSDYHVHIWVVLKETYANTNHCDSLAIRLSVCGFSLSLFLLFL